MKINEQFSQAQYPNASREVRWFRSFAENANRARLPQYAQARCAVVAEIIARLPITSPGAFLWNPPHVTQHNGRRPDGPKASRMHREYSSACRCRSAPLPRGYTVPGPGQASQTVSGPLDAPLFHSPRWPPPERTKLRVPFRLVVPPKAPSRAVDGAP